MTEKKKIDDVDALLTEVTGVVPTAKVRTVKAPAASTARPAPAQAAPAKAAEPDRKIRIRMMRSGICTPVDQKAALKGLGLSRIRQEVVRVDNSGTRGQIRKVRHLVEVVGTE